MESSQGTLRVSDGPFLGGRRLDRLKEEPFGSGDFFRDGLSPLSHPPLANPMATAQLDKDLLCPICMDPMRDAFLTACGHSFCYGCITTHLANRRNCPCCSQFLTHEQIFPNFALNKLLKKATASQLAMGASASEHLRFALQQGGDMTVKELDSLLVLLSEKRRKAEQEEAEMNMDILLDFLHRSRQHKLVELEQLRTDLSCIRTDIAAVERRRQELQRMRYECLAAMSTSAAEVAAHLDARASGLNLPLLRSSPTSSGRDAGRDDDRECESKGGTWASASPPPGSAPSAGPVTAAAPAIRASDMALAASVIAKKKRVFSHFEDLQESYLQHRRASVAREAKRQTTGEAEEGLASGEASPAGPVESREGAGSGLQHFQQILSSFTRFSRMKVVAELRHGDLFHSSNIVSSIEFDRDDELFATAGVSRRIKIFSFATVVSDLADVHCPVVEMPTRSKLSCLSWNQQHKAQVASSDYEGIVTVWDVTTCQALMEYEEHEKRTWSVDFSSVEPTQLVSGSDDGKVKIWCTNQESSVLNIDMKANICCVKFNPGSQYHIAVGSADHHIHYFDIRNASMPLHVFSGHRKAVSYVKFVSPTELASASTDSTLRLWDVQNNNMVRTLRGHVNEKNFVGLAVNGDFVACGSETNEVFAYYKGMPKPVAVHRFGTLDPLTGEDSDEDTAHFISAVCWKSDALTMLAANSQGTIKVLSMAQ